jgi:hypothetical protein
VWLEKGQFSLSSHVQAYQLSFGRMTTERLFSHSPPLPPLLYSMNHSWNISTHPRDSRFNFLMCLWHPAGRLTSTSDIRSSKRCAPSWVKILRLPCPQIPRAKSHVELSFATFSAQLRWAVTNSNPWHGIWWLYLKNITMMCVLIRLLFSVCCWHVFLYSCGACDNYVFVGPGKFGSVRAS